MSFSLGRLAIDKYLLVWKRQKGAVYKSVCFGVYACVCVYPAKEMAHVSLSSSQPPRFTM